MNVVSRSGWKTLIRMAYVLCQFYDKHKLNLPADFPASGKVAIEGLCAVVEALVAYDRGKAGGTFYSKEPPVVLF